MVEVLPWIPKPDNFAIVRTPLFSVLELRPLDLQRISFFEVKDPPTEVHAINAGATGSMAVPYEVRNDPELGRCLHAAAPIKKGDLVWRFSNLRVYNQDSLKAFTDRLSREDAKFLLEHVYMDSGCHVEIFDAGVLFNHSSESNCGQPSELDDPAIAEGLSPHATYALRPIAAGDQLTVNYNNFYTDAWFEALYESCDVDTSYMQES